jgi:hypothetical protein
VREVLAVSFIAACLSGCAPRSERSVAASDLVFGAVPGTETVLRVKTQCSAEPSNGGPRRVVPVGDYLPVYADSDGIFYAAPARENVRCTNCPPGVRLPRFEGWGVYFPINARSSSPPFFWHQVVSTEWGRVRGEKLWALPAQCWQPYGNAMAIVRKGEEVPLR